MVKRQETYAGHGRGDEEGMAVKTRRKWVGILVIVVGLLLLGADVGHTDRGGHGYRGHRGHGHRGHRFHHGHRGPRVRIGIGVGTFWGPHWGWGPDWPYYAYPPVVVAPSPVVVQPLPPQPQYWYYCDDAKSYYPYVAQCPGGWRAVTPTPP
jgi:hypothetical protein